METQIEGENVKREDDEAVGDGVGSDVKSISFGLQAHVQLLLGNKGRR